MGKILDAILAKQYPNTDGISFEQLLEWDLWPSFIVVFSKLNFSFSVVNFHVHIIHTCTCMWVHVCVCVCVYNHVYMYFYYADSEAMITRGEVKGQTRSCLPDRSDVLCTCAVSTLEGICQSILSGDITVKELHKITSRMDHMEKLCSAMKSGNLEKKGKEYDVIMDAIKARLREYKAFTNRKNLLGSLCQGIIVNVKGKFGIVYCIQCGKHKHGYTMPCVCAHRS